MTNVQSSIDYKKAESKSISRIMARGGYTHYFNSAHKMLELSGVRRVLFEFICEEMGRDDNEVAIDETLYDKFEQFLRKITGGRKSYTQSAFKAAKKQLKDLGLIIPLTRGYYRVNPKFAFKGTKKEREVLLKATSRLLNKRGAPNPILTVSIA